MEFVVQVLYPKLKMARQSYPSAYLKRFAANCRECIMFGFRATQNSK